jgi:putative ABC transport system permease protein
VLFSKEFTKWVLLANLIAWPIAYYIMKKWLQHFAYHTTIRIDMFIISGLLTFLLALLTVSYQSIKAARANPVDALKYE